MKGRTIGAAAILCLVFAATGCESECIWEPVVETNDDGSCLISTDNGEDNCWGGITVTCVPNDGVDGANATFTCSAQGETDCGVPIELSQTTAPSCEYFAQEINYEVYTAAWAECWAWETSWWYW